MWSFEKKTELAPALEHAGETEQRTPKAGYILLIAMFITSLFFGWRALDDLQDVPQKPEYLSSCASTFITYQWEDNGRYGEDRYIPPPEMVYQPKSDYYPTISPAEAEVPCVFSSFEANHGVPAVFEGRKSLDLGLRNANLGLQQVFGSIADYERQYSLALQENLTPEQKKLYNVGVIQKNLESLRSQRTDLQNQIDQLKAQLKPTDEQLGVLYAGVLSDFRSAWRWYELKVFLLEAIFVFPFFFFVFSQYRRLLFRKSPYTIIFTALLGVASVLVIRVLISWFWSLFLARIIQALWAFIQNFALLKSLVFYGGMALSIAIFGGAVYLLQKHIFDPRRVAIRSLRNKKCPRCETTLDLAGEYCANCGKHIQEKCGVCEKLRIIDLPHCPHCGSLSTR